LTKTLTTIAGRFPFKVCFEGTEGNTVTTSARNPQMPETYAFLLAFNTQPVISRFGICLLHPRNCMKFQEIRTSLGNKRNSWATKTSKTQDVNIQSLGSLFSSHIGLLTWESPVAMLGVELPCSKHTKKLCGNTLVSPGNYL
jgi:hypothetical protein